MWKVLHEFVIIRACRCPGTEPGWGLGGFGGLGYSRFSNVSVFCRVVPPLAGLQGLGFVSLRVYKVRDLGSRVSYSE